MKKSHFEKDQLSLFSKITNEENAQENKPSLFDKLIAQQDDEKDK